MLIINDNKTVAIFSEALSEINIHSSGMKIMARFENPMAKDIVLGEYDSKKKTERAFGILLNSLTSGDEWCGLPNNHSSELNTTLQSDANFRRLKTTGKTK